MKPPNLVYRLLSTMKNDIDEVKVDLNEIREWLDAMRTEIKEKKDEQA